MKSRLELGVIAAALAVTVATSIGAVYYVKALSDLGATASKNSALSFDDRELAGGNSVLLDQAVAYEARAMLLRTATYRVRIGPRLRHATPFALAYVEPWLRYFLMPRRPSDTSRWIVCYGCDTSELQGSYDVRWRDRNGVSIGRLR